VFFFFPDHDSGFLFIYRLLFCLLINQFSMAVILLSFVLSWDNTRYVSLQGRTINLYRLFFGIVLVCRYAM